MKRLCLAIALATFALHAGGAAAQTYPNKPIRIVVPFVAAPSTCLPAWSAPSSANPSANR